jgi:hypothetical protein
MNRQERTRLIIQLIERANWERTKIGDRDDALAPLIEQTIEAIADLERKLAEAHEASEAEYDRR